MLQSTSRLVSQIQQQAHLAEPPTADFIRGLVTQCKALASHYRTTPEVVLERAWWRTLYAAGICLRDALEASRNHRKRLGLSDKEVEQAYYALIQVAYFFEPGGVAEKVFQEQGWVWSDEEQRQTSW
jgi:hypothetical protein